MTLLTDDAAERLRQALGARIVLPGDAAYDAARMPWNIAVDQRPYAVALPETEEEVVAIVRAAAASGLRVAPQSTGHGAGAMATADLSQTVLVSLSGMRGVTVDADERTATVRGGAQWHDVLSAATPFGLTALHGSAGDVSVAGYSLSGGVSFYGRQHGLAVNAVRSVRIVTADGEIVTASADENADLFWAVRGGSGAFGVVVSLEIDLLPYADVFAGLLLWDGARAAEIVNAWTGWTATVPESVSTSLRILHLPPLPTLPPFLAGRSVVAIDGAILETDGVAAQLLAPLRALEPEMDTFARIPAGALVEVHMDPPEPSPSVNSHVMLDHLDEDAVAALVRAAFEARPMMSELRHTGGAFARPGAGGGAISAVQGEYLLAAMSIVPVPEAMPGARAAARAVTDAVAPWHGPDVALTFLETDSVGRRAFGTAADRLAALKRRFDPQDVFVAAHPVT